MPTQTTNHSEFMQAVFTISDYTCFRRGCRLGNWTHCERCGRHQVDFLKQTKQKAPRSRAVN